jgi:hypothetical protein
MHSPSKMRTDTEQLATDVTTQAIVQAPLALLLFTAPGGVTSVPRKLPLVLLLLRIGALFWPPRTSTPRSRTAEGKPDGFRPAATFY